jgi:A/G-specific adenine glycosylase
MLQQTTTAAVEGYYRRFLQRFPNVQTLAVADLTEVYRFWEGLGYYRRATQLHKAAGVIVEKHNDVFPQTFEEVLALPGIGRYTAGAVLSIAHDRRLPILEANTIRLHSRLLGITTSPFETETNKRLWAFAEEILPNKNAGRFNQALMDIGSRVCTLKQPCCLGETDCPLVGWCQCARLGLQRKIPVPKAKPSIEEVTEIAVLVRKRGKILLIQYPEGVRWAGLWDFPRCQDDGLVAKTLGDLTGRKMTLGRPISTHKHVVTRFKITLHFVEGKDGGPLQKPQYAIRWVKPEELDNLPLNSTGRKLANEL